MRLWRYLNFFRSLFDPRKALQLEQIEGLGLLAVKIAQMYSVREDLIGPEKSRQLRRFLEDAAPASRAEIESRFLDAAPPALLADLKDWEQVPMATASVGQVHRGTLRDGSAVAIKLIKADARKEFVAQVTSLRRALRVILLLYPKLARVADPLGALASVEESTLRELDLRTEAAGSAQLAAIRDEGQPTLPHLGRLEFPHVYEAYSGPEILVSEWRSEPSVNSLIARGEFGYEDALKLFRIHGYFLFLRGVFHGDLHPGNVLYDGESFIFLDNANVETASLRLCRGILGMLVALGEDRLGEAVDYLAGLSLTPLPATSLEKLTTGMKSLYRGFRGKTVSEVSLTQQMTGTVKLAVDCGVEFPQQAFPVIKSLMNLDGIVRACAPDAVLLQDTSRFKEDREAYAAGRPEAVAV